ncbi:MAG: IS110 family transposase [Streptosporangiaceae bacterium]
MASAALPPAQFFAGLDWAAEVHAVCVMDAAGKIADRFAIAHSADGIATLIRRPSRLAGPADVQVQHQLRVAAPYADETRALRTVSRTRTDLVEIRVAATN